jgi:uncharacterized protein
VVEAIVDTSVLVSAANAAEPEHQRCYRVLTDDKYRLIVSPLVLAEADYMIARLGNVDGEVAMLEDIQANMTIASSDNKQLAQAIQLVKQYAGLNIGVTDASLVVLAAQYRTTHLMTLDRRHFQTITPLKGSSHFTLLPNI